MLSPYNLRFFYALCHTIVCWFYLYLVEQVSYSESVCSNPFVGCFVMRLFMRIGPSLHRDVLWCAFYRSYLSGIGKIMVKVTLDFKFFVGSWKASKEQTLGESTQS